MQAVRLAVISFDIIACSVAAAGRYKTMERHDSAVYKKVHMIENNDKLIRRIYSWENLFNAYQHAAKGKWFENEVVIFSQNLEENLIEIQNELINRTYKVGRYHEFYVYEP